MSTSIKSAVREVLESINPLRRKKKKVNPLTADPKTVDATAMEIGAEAVMLFRRAAKAGVSLGDRLVERRDDISEMAMAKQYDLARTQLQSYRRDVEASVALKEDAALYADPPGMTADETEHARLLRLSIGEDIDALQLDKAADEIGQLAEVIARAQMRQDLGLDRVAEIMRGEINATLPEGTLPKEKTEIEALQKLALKALEPPLTAEKIEKARALAKPVSSAMEAIQRRLDVSGADPAVQYERLKMRRDDILKYPAEYRSPAIAAMCDAVDKADTDVMLKVGLIARAVPFDRREEATKTALAAIAVLRQKIEQALPALQAHDTEVRKYFTTLKKMTPQIKVADTLPEVDAGSDTPWKAERQAYDVSRGNVVRLQDEKKFREANVELANCARLMKALLDKRRVAIDGDIAGAADDEDARDVVNDLDAKGLLSILTAQQQLDLIRKMPADPDTTPPTVINNPARLKIFENPALDEEFVKAERAVLKDVIKMLRGDDGNQASDEAREAKKKWQEYEQNWAAWAGADSDRPGEQDLPKIEAIFQDIAEKQFEKLLTLSGIDRNNLPPGFTFPKPAVTVQLVTMGPGDFGETIPTVPAVIKINKAHSMFGDFKEMMDTILHENTHAWQGTIIAQFNGWPPFANGDQFQAKVKGNTALPSMKIQAELFAENLASYTGDSNNPAYRHEPLEEQAWTFGGKSSQALLVPPPQRSFDSSKGLKNKFWMVTSLSRTANASIRLKERHGIYVDEWEGERAKDKKLTLEGVPGLPSSQRLTVRGVVNEYTLKLDLDATTLRGRVVQKSEYEMEMQALAKTRYPGRKFAELSGPERKLLLDDVLLAQDWEATGSEDTQTLVVRAKDEVDVEHARLVLDESVEKLS